MMMKFEKLCRLCGSDGGVLVNMFEPPPGVVPQIKALIPNLSILQYDCLPKVICHRCVGKIREFHEFRSTCFRTQNHLRKLIPSMKTNESRGGGSSKRSREGSPMVLFMEKSLLETSTVAVEVLTLSDDDDDELASKSLSTPNVRKQSTTNTGSPMPASVRKQLQNMSNSALPKPASAKIKTQNATTNSASSVTPASVYPSVQNVLSSATPLPASAEKNKKRKVRGSSSPMPASAKKQAEARIARKRFAEGKASQTTVGTGQDLKISSVQSLAPPPGDKKKLTTTNDSGVIIKESKSSVSNQEEKSDNTSTLLATKTTNLQYDAVSNQNKEDDTQFPPAEIIPVAKQSSSSAGSVTNSATSSNTTPRRPKPGPKCKRRRDKDDDDNVNENNSPQYSKRVIKAISISGRNKIYTCSGCYKIFTNPEVGENHSCPTDKSEESAVPEKTKASDRNFHVVVDID